MARPSRVALALGSGGARGYAHIGVIAELEARGFEIVTVAGSSMGALVGGLYCAGKLDDYVDWTSGLSQLDVVRLLDVSLTKPGVIGAERILTRVREILGDTAIEDLPIPFTAIATDLSAGRAVWFQRGNLADALRASIAIPGVISPHEHKGRLLADGGILDPLPVAPTSGVPSDVTIGVILGSDGGPETGASRQPKAKGLLRRNVAPILDNEFVRSVRDRFGSETGDLADTEVATDGADEVAPAAVPDEEGAVVVDTAAVSPDTADEPQRMGRVEVLSRSLDIMQEALTRYQVAGYPPDVLIRVPRRAVRTLDFHKATEMIDLGRELTAKALDDLPELP
ncbi:patatin-like phospholipase family protein [Gordonia alkanivorans]|jgi:NTE family protein|uniref:patatin-like phospholipase family protein n=1 Tax=Gordonia TaxID=2053 RepID=UPI000FDDD99D|nr:MULTISPECIES: patatin-like phospholipase family protein [Gordonia]AZZ83131.1 esterase [Gordonia alkanivorans]MDH3014611.1 patatin-like phospholipase family protein [Gordonia alkanivorans]MDH3039769.1 patatin-like phospholipase family protein [Gordonia alkanivorans]MDH3058633.1 patatin-like phospholipase family protein [Gordonia alkanivorans]WJG14726.1 patatin-like phospholipase family protein [Gordonia sp. Swx-4]